MAGGAARPRGALEAEVLGCLAAAGGPMTAGQVRASLGGGLAYTTVMTTLARLHGKGAIERHRAGRAFGYSLVGGPDRARSNITAHQMLKLLEDESDRASALSAFVAELRPEDERLLTELLEQLADDVAPPGQPEE
jgi:predicted transcriptional regulator